MGLPNILFLVADDLGFNDVGFHGSKQIPTPHLDALAADGVDLLNYHTHPVCSPSRASMLSGRHAIHHGIYMPFAQGTAYHLGLEYELLPGALRRLGYETHAVGKWHLGQNTRAALPTGRGFDSYLGYWSGAEDYFAHDCAGAYDFAVDETTAWAYDGVYSAYSFTDRAVDVVESASTPYFLYVAWQNVHWPLEVPARYLEPFGHVPEGPRRNVSGMVSALDEAVGNVTNALKARRAYDDAVVVFVSDNGGPTNGDENTASNNWPLRGGKNTLYEGGTRVVGLLKAPGVAKSSASRAKLHAVDWFPTLYRFAGGGPLVLNPPLAPGDGVDSYDVLARGAPGRDELLLEAHAPGSNDTVHGEALIVGDWKFLRIGTVRPDSEAGWTRPPGQEAHPRSVVDCGAAREPADANATRLQCVASPCLFHVAADPCERVDLAGEFPDVLAALDARLDAYRATAVPPVAALGCAPVVVEGAWRPCDDVT